MSVTEKLSIIHQIIISFSILIGGAWAYFRFDTLFEQQIARAALERAEIEAAIAKKQLLNKSLISIDLDLSQLRENQSRFVFVDLKIKNSGNTTLTIPVEQDVRFYITQIKHINTYGNQVYMNSRLLKFDYPDSELTKLIIEPNNEWQIFRTIQKVPKSGLYIINFSVKIENHESQNPIYLSAQRYIFIN